ncbi:A/G-specific adenine glycosylase [Corynebacterium aquatimens]|uniref:A/G-specific adenine glycosylase n=1 Tax=Corynebacterium aquatimens TaxID=1190508 RepID=UPI002540F127|nr:A/G-specific adenine glycosylase [Corynebacterium aquatimens]QYH19245.1 A/G-specific adenine glycosylase [Corynebacterium aquatimens]
MPIILALTVSTEHEIQRPIIDWYRANARPLPWRAPGTTPWGVLLSEVMSHQTQVERVAPIWQDWVRRWPTPQAFAQERIDEILRAWGSLGYPRRALRLHECSRAIVEQHGGEVPAGVDALLALPGIGDYTARAVACFAFGQNVAVVDTNVRRVYARAILGRANMKPRKAELADVAGFLPATDGPTFSVGLMELGALICTSRAPQCHACPIAAHCAWLAAGRPAPLIDETLPRQTFQRTDRQVRGKIMKLLRESPEPVPQADIDVVWPDGAQRARALFSLIEDGLAEQTPDGRFRLPR